MERTLVQTCNESFNHLLCNQFQFAELLNSLTMYGNAIHGNRTAVLLQISQLRWSIGRQPLNVIVIGLHQSIQLGCESLLWRCANLLVNDLSVLEE